MTTWREMNIYHWTNHMIFHVAFYDPLDRSSMRRLGHIINSFGCMHWRIVHMIWQRFLLSHGRHCDKTTTIPTNWLRSNVIRIDLYIIWVVYLHTCWERGICCPVFHLIQLTERGMLTINHDSITIVRQAIKHILLYMLIFRILPEAQNIEFFHEYKLCCRILLELRFRLVLLMQ